MKNPLLLTPVLQIVCAAKAPPGYEDTSFAKICNSSGILACSLNADPAGIINYCRANIITIR